MGWGQWRSQPDDLAPLLYANFNSLSLFMLYTEIILELCTSIARDGHMKHTMNH